LPVSFRSGKITVPGLCSAVVSSQDNPEIEMLNLGRDARSSVAAPLEIAGLRAVARSV
jgi:hypothetical protein